MGQVFVHTLISLDGFIADPDDDMSWVFQHVGDTVRASLHTLDVWASGQLVKLRLRVDKAGA